MKFLNLHTAWRTAEFLHIIKFFSMSSSGFYFRFEDYLVVFM